MQISYAMRGYDEYAATSYCDYQQSQSLSMSDGDVQLSILLV